MRNNGNGGFLSEGYNEGGGLDSRCRQVQTKGQLEGQRNTVMVQDKGKKRGRKKEK